MSSPKEKDSAVPAAAAAAAPVDRRMPDPNKTASVLWWIIPILWTALLMSSAGDSGGSGGGGGDGVNDRLVVNHAAAPISNGNGNGNGNGYGSTHGSGSGDYHKCVVCDGRGHVSAILPPKQHAADGTVTSRTSRVITNPHDAPIEPDLKHNCKTYILTLLMAAFYTVMNCFAWVIQHHPALTHDQFKVAFMFLAQSFVAQLAFSAAYTRYQGRNFWPLWRGLFPARISGIIGFCGGITAVCSMVAGPFLPAAVQTIFYQSQTIIIYWINTRVFLNPVKWYHHVIIGSIVTFNLATAWDGGFTSSVGPGMIVVWSFIFMANSLGTGLSNNMLEAFFSACHVNPHDPDDHRLRGGYTILDYVFAMNAIGCFWSLISLVPLFPIAWLAYGSDVWRQVFLDWSAFSSNGQWYVFGMGSCAWVYSYISSWVITETNALWMTVASSLAVLAQLAFFNTPIAGTTYESPLNTTNWINNVLLCIITTIYTIGQPNKIHNVENWIYKMYKRGLDVYFPPALEPDMEHPPVPGVIDSAKQPLVDVAAH